MPHPSATIVVPFRGAEAELRSVAARFEGLRREPDDALVVVDNGGGHSLSGPDKPRLIAADGLASPGHARNVGAREALTEWLVFCDADTEPCEEILDAYFNPPPGPSTAVLAGGVEDDPGGGTLAARLAHETAAMSQRASLENAFMPYALTANCAIRREAFEQAGGFDAGILAGEDADLCWRLQRLGWGLEERPAARVGHRSRQTMSALWRQRFRHGSGAAWLESRYPGSMPAWGLPALARDSAGRILAGLRARLRGESGALALAAAGVSAWWAFELGRLASNRAGTTSRGR